MASAGSCRPGFFLPVRVLSRLFRRLFLDRLAAPTLPAGWPSSAISPARRTPAFAAHLAPLRRAEWVVYAKRPFGGPEAVLAYLSRYTHRVAIANSRLIALDDNGVTFRWKDYAPGTARRYKTMTLAAEEFIRRFLLHVLPRRLPPHPPLRLVRQSRRRQPHPRPPTARRAKAASRARRCRSPCWHRPASLRAGLSPLWRTHVHHRDVQTRCGVTLSTCRANHHH